MTATVEGPPASRSRIFISYRHGDSDHAVGRLAEDLRQQFAPQQVFQDFASIAPNADFEDALQQGLETCAVLLVVIGPHWLTAVDKKGHRRLDLPHDWVRCEVAECLKHKDVRVFPVLLDAEMPGEEALPEDLQPLTKRQSLPLTARHWTNDVAKLVKFLKGVSGQAAAPGPVLGVPTVPPVAGAPVSRPPASGLDRPSGVKPPRLVWKPISVFVAAARIAILLATLWSTSCQEGPPPGRRGEIARPPIFSNPYIPWILLAVAVFVAYNKLAPRLSFRLLGVRKLRTRNGALPGIFISYRREDAAGWAGHLQDALRREFPDNEVFYDIGSIEPGLDFPNAIRRALSSCVVAIVLVGPRWLDAKDETGRRRLEDPGDWVRLEVAESLQRQDLRVVPVLVGAASMPSPAELPEPLRPLARRNAHEISDNRWDYDVSQLVAALRKFPELAGASRDA